MAAMGRIYRAIDGGETLLRQRCGRGWGFLRCLCRNVGPCLWSAQAASMEGASAPGGAMASVDDVGSLLFPIKSCGCGDGAKERSPALPMAQRRERPAEPNQTKPNQAKPNQTKPNQAIACLFGRCRRMQNHIDSPPKGRPPLRGGGRERRHLGLRWSAASAWATMEIAQRRGAFREGKIAGGPSCKPARAASFLLAHRPDAQAAGTSSACPRHPDRTLVNRAVRVSPRDLPCGELRLPKTAHYGVGKD